MILGPMVKIEIENIRHQLMHAFVDYQDSLSSQVKAQLDRVVSEEAFASMLATEVRRAFENEVRRAIASYFDYGEGHTAIRAAIDAAMKTPAPEATP